MPEYKGIEYLRKKLAQKTPRVQTRYRYYEMQARVRDLQISTPKGLENMSGALGWCAKAVDCVADRLVFREFQEDLFDMNTIFSMNNKDVLINSAILGALISSCDFIHISADDEGYPRLQVIRGDRATGVLDPLTNMLTEGYAILDVDDYGKPTREVYSVPGCQYYYTAGEKQPQVIQNKAPYALLVPVIYKPDAARPFGHSRITRACMDLQQSAMRTMKRSEIAAEFYSFPQKYVLGTDPNAERLDKWRASMSMLLEITKDEDGDKPVMGQFTTQSMSPHVEMLRAQASMFAGETGLTLDDLGFVSDNPSSAEAIKASHETLRLVAEKAQGYFGTALLNTGYLASCVRDDFTFQRRQIYSTIPKWEPAFRPDASTLSLIGDGAIKINQAIPGYIDNGVLRDLTGIAGGAS